MSSLSIMMISEKIVRILLFLMFRHPCNQPVNPANPWQGVIRGFPKNQSSH